MNYATAKIELAQLFNKRGTLCKLAQHLRSLVTKVMTELRLVALSADV